MKLGLGLIAAVAGLLSTPSGLVDLTTPPVGVWRERRRDGKRFTRHDGARLFGAQVKRERRAARDLRTWTGGRL